MNFNSQIEFPDPRMADDDGLVAIGGELSPEFLVAAYAQGIFPWFNPGDQYLWWSPNPRMVLLPTDFKRSKSFRQLMRKGGFELRIDTAFEEVIEQCSKISRSDQEGTWITDEMKAAYIELHRLGIAHSFETHMDGELCGGLYGVSLGKAFFGESMFHLVSNASKIAFNGLVEFCLKHSFHFIDAQQSTQHLKSLGAHEMDRDEFLDRLDQALGEKSLVGNWGIEGLKIDN